MHNLNIAFLLLSSISAKQILYHFVSIKVNFLTLFERIVIKHGFFRDLCLYWPDNIFRLSLL